MVVAAASQKSICSEKISRDIELPIIDLCGERSEVAKQIVKACEEFGFFKVVNHGVSKDVIRRIEEQSVEFFAKGDAQKLEAGPANPFGYGKGNIGFNGDSAAVEYLLLRTHPDSLSDFSQLISSNDPLKFRSAASAYIEAVREVACDILILMAEGLWVQDTKVFSRLISDIDSDCFLRLNHYPPLSLTNQPGRVGFGEHSDPQLLTLLRSNDVGGLEISSKDGVWIPVNPDPAAICVNVGDVLQAMTNGRFTSVRHRVVINSEKERSSIAYFGAPPLHANITAPPETVTPQCLRLYRPFTWSDYKQAAYSLRLADTRLSLFLNSSSSLL